MKTCGMIKQLFGTLRSSRGETIVETLISVLVSSLALLMLATAIGTSVRIVMKSKAQMKEFYQAESEVVSNAGHKTSSSDTTYTTEVPIRLIDKVSGKEPEKTGDIKAYSTEGCPVSLYGGE